MNSPGCVWMASISRLRMLLGYEEHQALMTHSSCYLARPGRFRVHPRAHSRLTPRMLSSSTPEPLPVCRGGSSPGPARWSGLAWCRRRLAAVRIGGALCAGCGAGAVSRHARDRAAHRLPDRLIELEDRAERRLFRAG